MDLVSSAGYTAVQLVKQPWLVSFEDKFVVDLVPLLISANESLVIWMGLEVAVD